MPKFDSVPSSQDSVLGPGIVPSSPQGPKLSPGPGDIGFPGRFWFKPRQNEIYADVKQNSAASAIYVTKSLCKV